MSVIIAVCGPIGSGKGTVSIYLHSNYYGYVLDSPQVLKELCHTIGVPPGRISYQKMAVAIGEAFGGEHLLIPLLKRFAEPWPPLIVYDGIRYLAQHEYLKSLTGHTCVLIAVDAPIDIRYQRVSTRKQYSDEKGISREEFDQNMLHPIEHDTPALMALADYHLDNSGTEEYLFGQLEPIIAQCI